jgi:hypothetical protein
MISVFIPEYFPFSEYSFKNLQFNGPLLTVVKGRGPSINNTFKGKSRDQSYQWKEL